jgi:hypothetical protein
MSALVPWILGHGSWCAAAQARAPLPGCAALDVLSPATLPFFQLVNAGNARAYGEGSMPPWVQLDCACLPNGMIGLAVPRAHIEDALWRDLVEAVARIFGAAASRALDSYDGLVPLSEYGCVPTPEPGHVVGFSLYSLRKTLGVRTKAMALLMQSARWQTGVAQVDNRALRTHTALGPLHIVAAQVAAHSQPQTTFVYRLRVPEERVLEDLARGGRIPERPPGTVRLAIGETTTGHMAELLAREGPHAIVDVERGTLVLAPTDGG